MRLLWHNLGQKMAKSLNFKKYIGQKLKAKRLQFPKFKTQQDLSNAISKKYPDIDIDQSRISRWESGENIPTKYIDVLCDVLKIDEGFFDEITFDDTADILRDVANNSKINGFDVSYLDVLNMLRDESPRIVGLTLGILFDREDLIPEDISDKALRLLKEL